MRILLYNYAQPLLDGHAGGGVTVYLRMLVGALRHDGHRVYTLSSGTRRTPWGGIPVLRRREDSLMVYNAPSVAPNVFAFHHPRIYLESAVLDGLPQRLHEEIGELDVLHFHNLEGLTLGFFTALRSQFPRAAIVLTAHNYGLLCNQTNLWHAGSEACTDFDGGVACQQCATVPDLRRRQMLINGITTSLRDHPWLERALRLPATVAQRRLARGLQPACRAPDPGAPTTVTYANREAPAYALQRETNIDLTRCVFDRVLAVSRRTRDVLVSRGVAPSDCDVMYIGTRHWSRLAESARKFPRPGALHLGYLGYARKDKGFFVLLEALRLLPEAVARTCTLTVAARVDDPQVRPLIEDAASRLAELRLFDGYTHDQLTSILAPVDCGIVPPLWEDCLPQVAIEFVTSGVPILCSDRGGAGEIADDPAFLFAAGDSAALADRIVSMHNGTLSLQRFWSRPLRLRSEEDHVRELIELYARVLEARRSAGSEAG